MTETDNQHMSENENEAGMQMRHHYQIPPPLSMFKHKWRTHNPESTDYPSRFSSTPVLADFDDDDVVWTSQIMPRSRARFSFKRTAMDPNSGDKWTGDAQREPVANFPINLAFKIQKNDNIHDPTSINLQLGLVCNQ